MRELGLGQAGLIDRESRRLSALRSYRVLDTPSEAAFDEIADLAAQLLHAPIALVSLVDETRQWFKAKIGLEACSTDRDVAFCAHALSLPAHQVMVVPDAKLDPRFSDNPHVTGEPYVRFYAGALLTDREGFNLGTLCVIDPTPRPRGLTPQETAQLRTLAGVVVDRLEAARTGRALAEQRRMLTLAERMSGVGRWRFDFKTDDVVCSDEVYRIYGLDPEHGDPTQETIMARHPPESQEILATAFADARRDGGGFEVELQLLRDDGARRTITIQGAAEIGDGGEVEALFGVIQDVTEQRESVRRIQRSQARYKLLADHMGDVITRIGIDGSSNYISPAIERLLGFLPAEMRGQPAQAFIHPDDRPALMRTLREMAAGREEAVLEHRAVRRDGSEVWVESRLRLVRDAAGRAQDVVVVIRDISQRKALQAQLSAARDAAEAAHRAKSDFLANMSHELRTPLNGVIGFSRLLAESPDLNETDRRRARLVRGAGEGLNALINDVLDFSKLEARAVQLELRPFALNDMVSEALAMIEPSAMEKGLELRIEGADPGAVVGDKYRLRQVLLNLLTNAVKFTASGSIVVRLDPTDIGTSRQRVRISVADQGVGVPPEKVDLLFKRFSQADTSVARTFGGTGLGLAISRELIELMDGEIGVTSQAGEGSTFWFEVELERAETPLSHERHQAGRAMFPGRTVLVVDDVPLNRELAEVMLRQHGCEVRTAADGEEAVEAALGEHYDLVLMDVHMPVMDGLAAASALRAAGRTDLPIVALSASGAPEQVQACLAAGMNGHLLKPLAPQDLERALADVFSTRPAAISAAQPAEPVDDEQAAREALLESMGPAVTLRLVRLALDQFKDALASDAPDAVRAAAHRISGGAGMLGFHRLSIAARRLEDACVERGMDEILLAEARRELNAALSVLEDWRDQLENAASD